MWQDEDIWDVSKNSKSVAPLRPNQWKMKKTNFVISPQDNLNPPKPRPNPNRPNEDGNQCPPREARGNNGYRGRQTYNNSRYSKTPTTSRGYISPSWSNTNNPVNKQYEEPRYRDEQRTATFSTIKAKVLFNGKKAILNLTVSNLPDLQEQIKNKLNINGKFRIEYLDKDFGEFAELHEIKELKDLVELQISLEQENNLEAPKPTIPTQLPQEYSALSYHMTDLNELSNATLIVPIYGITNTPLVSFEDAIEPLIKNNRVPRLESYAETACAFAKTFKNSPQPITQDGIAAIHLYTLEWSNKNESLYYIMNACLRNQNREGLNDFFPYLKLLLTSMSCLPPTEEDTVFRGVKGDYRKDYKEGEFILWWGFSSCATHLGPVMEFLGDKGPRLLMHVNFINGKKIREFSYFKKEEEVLLPPGRYFKVSSVGYQNDLTIVHLKEFPSGKIDGPFARPFWKLETEKGEWDYYDSKSSDAIECALKEGKDKIQITCFGQSYTINVKKFTQTNNITGTIRKIKRIDPNM